ncbi:MAG: hypothetical protein WBN07_13500 [Woeseiaceae bacterium]
MGTVVAIVSVLLALVAAGSIAYIAWELTSERAAAAKSNDASEPVEKP